MCSSADNVEAVLHSIRSSVEQSQDVLDGNRDKTSDTGQNRCSDGVHNSPVNFTTPLSCYVPAVCHDGTSYLVSADNQMMASSSMGSSLLLDRNTQEPLDGSIPSCGSESSSGVHEALLTSETMTESFGIFSDNSGPQPAHYSSAPSGPQAKMPKYERIFLHDLPPTLPLPPTSGSSNAQYPSQEEVIGPKRRKEPHKLTEKDAIRNWYRQFDPKQTKPVVPTSAGSLESDSKTQLLKPKNIPFASPYIQTHDASSKAMDDPAVKEFDPSKPPPSVGSTAM